MMKKFLDKITNKELSLNRLFSSHTRWESKDDMINRLNEKVKSLEAGGCRFNCRTQKEAFMAGWKARDCVKKHPYGEKDLEALYKRWKDKS